MSAGGAGVAVPDYYHVQPGDTLSGVAERFYGTADAWPRVWSFNPAITNPHWIYPDGRIRLGGEGGEAGTAAGAASNAGSSGDRTVLVGGNAVDRSTILFRWQGYLERDALTTAGVILGSPLERRMFRAEDDVYFRLGGGRVPPAGE